MNRPLPRLLLVLLGVGATLSFIASLYLESRYLGFLQNHPIMVNLISGVVGFCSASLAVAVGFNWFIRRSNKRKALRLGVEMAWWGLTNTYSGLSRSIAKLDSAKPRDLKHMSALKVDIYREVDALINGCRRLANALNLEEESSFRGMLADATAVYDQINPRRNYDLDVDLGPMLKAYFSRISDMAYFIVRSVPGRDLGLRLHERD